MQYNFSTLDNENVSAHEFKLKFGKYKGSKLGELASDWDGRGYLSYLITTSINQEVIDKIEAVITTTPHVVPSLKQCSLVVIRFGQYKNMTLQEVVLKPNGMDYLKYIVNWEKCNPFLKIAIDVILDDFKKQLSLR